MSLLQFDDRADAPPEEDWAALGTALGRYARARTNRADLVEDVVQETLSRLVQQCRDRRPVSVYALGFRIAANLLVDHHRRDRRYAGEPEEQQPSDSPLPDRVVAGRQELVVLQAALAAMPPLRREVVVRRRLHGQSCAAIANDLELSLKAVEKHITRGLADLHRALATGDEA
ncbi:RNA polymerase sigma factor [Sphingomonas aracearum]|uniref:RNA polymerase sigma factor n=1 Tax=Sphingomonas aracearum TaxID=2283317 RepID=A0A369VPS2_9SPHN|nr:RNA polymerase sigma factor [Sphingomonas aracearum]RDE04396.1 RNA polymerase sigma factor [Sphingomonas aracearum]